MNDTTKLGYKKDATAEEKLALSLAMLESGLDNIETLPDFVTPPKGSYFVESVQKCEAGLNSDGTDVVIKGILVMGDTIELASAPGIDPTTLPEGSYPPAGSLFSFQFHGAIGIQKFKKVFASVSDQLNPSMPVKELVETLASGSVAGLTMITTLRADKEKVDVAADGSTTPKMYAELVSVQMV